MRLIVNLSMLGEHPTGLGVYADKCVDYLSRHYRLEYVGSQPFRYRGVVACEAPPSVAIGGGVGAAIERYQWASRLAFPADTLLYSPTHHGFPRAQRQILTIHDLVSIRHPAQHPAQYAYFRYMLPRLLRRCEALFTVSETTRHDVAGFYGYPLERIFVVPNSIEVADFKPVADAGPRVEGEYLLMVGAHYPHKNVEEVLALHALWAARYRLVVASCGGRHLSRLQRLAARYGLAGRVDFMGYVPREALLGLYRHAQALIYPSKWEGFGIPPMEALASGCRVILSDIPVHREVYAGACHFVSLGIPATWAAAFESLQQAPPAAMQGAAERVLARYTAANAGRALIEALGCVEPQLDRLALSAPALAASPFASTA